MAVFAGMFSRSSSSSSSIAALRRNGVKVGKRRNGGLACRAAAHGIGNLMDQYRTLRIQPGASEKEVKKAFRQLALQYHPDVCKGNNCGVQFHHINEAYDIVMSSLRASEERIQQEEWRFRGWPEEEEEEGDELRGMCDPNWELWEEWMGWEGAGIRDYSSHINPYI
ncbi:chaperone protein dnaJ 8, chloroplastic [Phalaenopsis equestris]|uniref:chaperone protein dnaJ 8, chloroplastic n=1 Tax=Phalaenopsis equestris TaxID=78828 RepID=UPI0009E431C5|nr:chaperone protein dnaJ 8, chloroplastic [Phalaenopsis equestris]